MLYIRPSIGWLSYFVLRDSPRRLGLVLAVGAVASLVCVWESQFTLTLTYQAPGPYPPPVVAIAPPDAGPMTAWDACGIEAATRPVKVLLKPRPISSKKTTMTNHDEIKKLLKDLPNPMKIHGGLNATRKGDLQNLDDLHDLLDQHDKVIDVIYDKMVNPPSGSIENSDIIYDKIVNQDSDSDGINDKMENQHSGSSQNSDGINDKMVNPHSGTPQSWQIPDASEAEEESEPVEMGWGEVRDELRSVWVYQWRPTVFKGDTWTHFVNKLPGVHLNYFDPRKGVPNTHLRSWGYREGLVTQTAWVGWVTAALSVLWGSGGMVIPTGVILTRPLTLTPMGKGVGVLLEGNEREDISPLVVGVPPQHGVVAAAFGILAQDDDLMSARSPDPPSTPLSYLTPTTALLKEAVKGGCDTQGVPDMGTCGDFFLLPRGEAVAVGDLQEGRAPARRTLLRYGGAPHDLQQPAHVSALFSSLRLGRFCPRVAGEVLGQRDL